jgi:prepilin-type N-terminal cleavage/methylation domain-containing protein
MNQLLKRSQGFTLIEILVSTFIFLMVSGAIIGTYNYILRLNQRAQAIRLATDQARFLLEYLTREVRNGKILYTNRPAMCGAGAIPMPSYYLPIVNVDGENECFYSSDAVGSSVDPNGNNLWLQKVSGGTVLPSTRINPTGVTVRNLRFFILPSTDPYASGSTRQESVTITGTVFSSPDPRNNVGIPFETTISLPLYDIPQT